MNKNLKNALKNVRISHSVRKIKPFFQNNPVNYKPDYQREYVWTPLKASYFIETILLHSEFTPIVVFLRNGVYEVIDGRQRCETIDRFLRDELLLKSSGLEKLWYLAGKRYSQLGSLQERIEEATIRIIIIEFKDEENIDPATEELVKREFFRRYNFGISPLKKEEVYKAQYLQDEINIFFKKLFVQHPSFYVQVRDLFDHRSQNIELQMQNIRQLLVLHNIPITRYLREGDDIVNMYYDYLSFENNGMEKIRAVFNTFRKKLDFLSELKPLMNKAAGRSNGLVYECLYWALSISELEKVKWEKINNDVFKDRFVRFFAKHVSDYDLANNNLAALTKNRYRLIAEFFASQLHVSYDKYIKSQEFTTDHKTRMVLFLKERIMPGMEREYFSKTTPTTSTIIDILDRMEKQKFIIRPPYQREEIKNESKASSLIESILLNIRLHPICVYVRKDGTCEVIDGQQRLLSIIGFMGRSYLDEKGNMSKSIKDDFRLRLRSGLLQEFHGMKFSDLPDESRKFIENFDIDLIEIREENNPHFKPEELFKRLNYKPFPIKEHSFEFWNAYIDGEVIRTIKGLCQKTPWMYLRKNDCRMLNEELMMHFAYLTCVCGSAQVTIESIKEVIKFGLVSERLTLQIRSRPHITQLLENELQRQDFLAACAALENDFISKLKVLTYHPESSNSESARSRQLDNLLNTKAGVRMRMHFYLLWILTRGISIQSISSNRPAVKNRLRKAYELFDTAASVAELESFIVDAWATVKKLLPLPVNA